MRAVEVELRGPRRKSQGRARQAACGWMRGRGRVVVFWRMVMAWRPHVRHGHGHGHDHDRPRGPGCLRANAGS